MMKCRFLWTLFCLAMLGCAGIPNARSPEADYAAIKQIWSNYVEFVEKGDAAGWLSQWDAEGISAPTRCASTHEKELDAQVPGAFKARIDANDTKMTINPLEIVVNGSWAFSRGTYTQDLKAKSSGKIIHVDGKFLTIFKKQLDGTWKIYRDCYNSNVPPK